MNISFTIGVCVDIDTKLDEQVVLERIKHVVDTMSHPLEVFENSFIDEIGAGHDDFDDIDLSVSVGELCFYNEEEN